MPDAPLGWIAIYPPLILTYAPAVIAAVILSMESLNG